MVGPAFAEPLNAADEALGRGDLIAVRAIAEPLAQAGDAGALALLALAAARDGSASTGETLTQLQAAAAAGSARAAFALGQVHQAGGLGLIADASRAVEAYGRAARLGHSPAEVALVGLLMQSGTDATALRARLENLVAEDAPGADLLLARMLAEGLGGVPDPARARQLAHQALDGGVPGAQRLVGWMTLQGVDSAPDPDRAMALLQDAAETDPAAATDLGLLHRDGGAGLRRDPARAAVWFLSASARGDGWAAYHLARLLSDGEDSVTDDRAQAARLMSLADRRGVAAASHRVALMLWDGVGVQADLPAARAAMERAVTRGYPLALNDLGAMVEGGVGRPADAARAAELYRAAAGAGDVLGAWNLADLYLTVDAEAADWIAGYTWCLWAERQSETSDHPLDCAVYAAGLTPEGRAAAIDRLDALLPGQTP